MPLRCVLLQDQYCHHNNKNSATVELNYLGLVSASPEEMQFRAELAIGNHKAIEESSQERHLIWLAPKAREMVSERRVCIIFKRTAGGGI